MNFQGSELESVRELARTFAHKELAPHVLELDDKEEFPLEAYQKLVKTKLHILNFPERFGGADSLLGLAVVAEELSRVDPGFTLSVMASSQLFGFNLLRLGTPEQKERYLRAIAEEGKLGCWALTEPDTGSNAVGIETRAVKEGNRYRLNGSKTFITNAPIADFFIILAREFGDGIEGGTAFIVERSQAGLGLSKPLKKMGHRTSPTGQIFLNNCVVPLSQVLGTAGKAFLDMKHSLDVERLGFMGIGLGIMKECLKLSVDYAKNRKQFGKAIAEYQLVQEHLAEMAVRVDLVQAYIEKGFSLYQANKTIHYEAAVMKVAGAQMCVEVAERAVQIFGGNGYMREYKVEKFLRDARLFPIGGGTTEMNKLIVARELLKNYQ